MKDNRIVYHKNGYIVGLLPSGYYGVWSEKEFTIEKLDENRLGYDEKKDAIERAEFCAFMNGLKYQGK